MIGTNDILINEETFDLLFENGDFIVDEANYQHIQSILLSNKGWWKQTPFLGANLPAQMKGILDNKFTQKVRLNLEADGFIVKHINLKNGTIEVEAKK
jgi:hypothetical protein